MRRDETRWLAGGIAIGLTIAGVLYGFRESIRGLDVHLGTEPALLRQTEPADTTVQTSDVPASVQLSAEEQTSIGVETVEVRRQAIGREIVTTGKVEEPETGIAVISARVAGRIDRLFLNTTGESIQRGQPVASIYSPEIVTAAEEYKLALDNMQRLGASKEASAISGAEQLIQASRRRLELWGLTAKQIEDIALSPETSVELTTFSSVSGIVTNRNVAEGQYVKEGDTLFTVTDLATVWIQADVFESDIPLIRNGQAATVTSSTLAGGSLRGTVTFLQPAVEVQTHTMRARIQVPNPGMRLRPGMFVQVSIRAPFETNVLGVPKSAVLETGKEKVVYVSKGNGLFEKRAIDAVMAGEEFYAVTKGIEAGEHVVTRGNFLIDSQTRLSGNITGMFGGSKGFGTETNSAPPAVSDYTITLRPEPLPPKAGAEGMFHVTVTDKNGTSVRDAQVQVMLLMPAMPSMGMGEMRSSVNLTWNGSEYTGTGTVAMAGPWNVTVEARRNGQLIGIQRSRFDAK